MKTILVTGGAGYIGSIAVKRLIQNNYNVIVIDNLEKGVKELVDKKAKLYEIDLTNKQEVDKVFQENKINAVIHFGAYKAVGESMSNAPKYSKNIVGSINLLDAMVEHKVNKIIFSSSAAVYGMPDVEQVDEDTPKNPINYYGYTKLAMEQLMDWYSQIHNINYIALRYFNVAGDELGYIDPAAQNVFPIIMQVITGEREKLTVFGDDYNTKDGTCIRDYIHVSDLVDAHVLALDANYNGPINLGTGNGVSVKELVEAFKEVSNKDFKVEIGKKRAGDPACLIASHKKAKEILKWEPKKNMKDMVQSTYNAYIRK